MNTEEHSSEDRIGSGHDADSLQELSHADGHGRASLRIVGEGGAAVTLQPVSMYARELGSTRLEAGFDIALVDPDHHLVFRNRSVTDEDVEALARFLTAALVAEDRSDFHARRGGFTIAMIPTADPSELIVRVELDPLATFGHTAPFRFVFVTTRVACWGASRAALRLAHSDVDPDLTGHLADLLRDREEGEAS